MATRGAPAGAGSDGGRPTDDAAGRGGRRLIRTVVVSLLSLGTATIAAAVLRRWAGIPDPSAVYLLAVVGAAIVGGTWPAVATSLAAFLAYDFLFVRPFYTFAVAAPEEWLHLLLFLVVALVIGRLTALQAERAEEAERRAAEARSLFSISRELAVAGGAMEAAPRLCEQLAREAEFERVWLALGPGLAEERVVADTEAGRPVPPSTPRWLLRSAAADPLPGWVRVHDPAARPSRSDVRRADAEVFRVPLEAAGETVGSLWGARRHGAPLPGRSHSRLMAAVADQLGQAVRRDRLAAELTAAEVARQGDALKTALLDSVSHDLRTPLAGIRAAAGSLLDAEAAVGPSEVRELAASIDAEAARLGRLVRDLLDLSRIEAGSLRPRLEPYELVDLVEPVAERLRPVLGDLRLDLDLPAELPPVIVDATFADEIVTNLLENAARYAPGGRARVGAAVVPGARAAAGAVELVVEDDGPGVPPGAFDRIFDKFYRVPVDGRVRAAGAPVIDVAGARSARPATGPRVGMGVGLAVVRGLALAMGGSVRAEASRLGGLAVVVTLPAAGPAPAETSSAAGSVDATGVTGR
ncbi:MAG TPA: DUF4118 domain-containing protein [Candidatus Limnocylindrales bacterium]